MIRRVLSGSLGSANILRQRKWEAQRANQPWAVAPPLRNYPRDQFTINCKKYNSLNHQPAVLYAVLGTVLFNFFKLISLPYIYNIRKWYC